MLEAIVTMSDDAVRFANAGQVRPTLAWCPKTIRLWRDSASALVASSRFSRWCICRTCSSVPERGSLRDGFCIGVTSDQPSAMWQSLGGADKFRFRFRNELTAVVGNMVRGGLAPTVALAGL